jgi:hypothetical protein
VWFDHSGGGSGELRHVRRLGRPGVEEAPNAEVRTPNSPTLVRRVLFLPSALLTANSSLLSIDGRKVLDLHAGANDVSALAPGVYFVRLSAGSVVSTGRLTLVR